MRTRRGSDAPSMTRQVGLAAGVVLMAEATMPSVVEVVSAMVFEAEARSEVAKSSARVKRATRPLLASPHAVTSVYSHVSAPSLSITTDSQYVNRGKHNIGSHVFTFTIYALHSHRHSPPQNDQLQRV